MREMTMLELVRSRFPRCIHTTNVAVGIIQEALTEYYNVNLEPGYQRSDCWTTDQSSAFVGALLENPSLIPPIWLNLKKDHESSEIIDGKQRIYSCLRWINGAIGAKCPCGIWVWHEDLCERDLLLLRTLTTMTWNFVELDRPQVLDFYLRLNSGGTVHREAELERVRNLLEKCK